LQKKNNRKKKARLWLTTTPKRLWQGRKRGGDWGSFSLPLRNQRSSSKQNNVNCFGAFFCCMQLLTAVPGGEWGREGNTLMDATRCNCGVACDEIVLCCSSSTEIKKEKKAG
jgi:hypothetical protein